MCSFGETIKDDKERDKRALLQEAKQIQERTGDQETPVQLKHIQAVKKKWKNRYQDANLRD